MANLSETCLGLEHVETLAAKAALAGAILRSLGPDANPVDVKARGVGRGVLGNTTIEAMQYAAHCSELLAPWT